MKRTVASVDMSLDGVIEHPERWMFDHHDDEAAAYAHRQLLASDALVMGRRTYQTLAGAWSAAATDSDVATRINTMPKYVVSSTLARADWGNTTIIGDDLPGEVSKLMRSGQNLLMYGFGPVAQTLMCHDLLDELRVWLHPVLLGRGNLRDLLFRDGSTAKLRLERTRTFTSGLVVLVYRPIAGSAA
ncbi:dihydrofolate reductase [Herbihabitans rhizosphaerae]|uniref:Dihydrofolate reductase n=1 Tax=Herbihabitans rhizosphaerae TaxID=1872711 RepID=A0A4Q7KN31_9PSEU|nr:dihydrofolate reductase family protein [Herbihabitans rhizosphaerae]RZS37774.1 dihydrofolate reductase [Herbihabitans rhizosphaerae]